mgnify:CR=1 FL=1
MMSEREKGEGRRRVKGSQKHIHDICYCCTVSFCFKWYVKVIPMIIEDRHQHIVQTGECKGVNCKPTSRRPPTFELTQSISRSEPPSNSASTPRECILDTELECLANRDFSKMGTVNEVWKFGSLIT